MDKNYDELIKELIAAKISIENAEKILSITSDTRIIKTLVEYNETILKVSTFLSTKSDANSIRGMKHRIENNKKHPTVKEAYEIQENFGIPIYAWKDFAWFKKTLLPK